MGDRQKGGQSAEGGANRNHSVRGKLERNFEERISQAMSMPMFDPGQRLAEEQDYVQAYENVREKYKGKNSSYMLK